MTNEELIAKIKAEIKRRIRELDEQIVDIYDSKAVLRKDELQKLLFFLSTIKSEKPMNLEEELNEEIKKEKEKLPFFLRGKDLIAFARHFAQWQKEQIMKNAKDGWIDEECVIVLNDDTRIDLQPDYEKKPAFEFEYAQDVQVIILPKEDSNDTRRKE